MQLPAAKGRNLRGAKRNLQWQLGMAQINQSWTETGPRQETETEEN